MTKRLISSGSPFEARIGYSRAVAQETPAEQTRRTIGAIRKAQADADKTT